MLLWNPTLAIERLAARLATRRRLRQLRQTPARALKSGHIESLELLQLIAGQGIEVIYDVGAHVGAWTLLAKSVLPDARIHAFEPFTPHCAAFERATVNLRGIVLHRVALGNVEGFAPLLVTNHSDSSSFLPVAQGGLEHAGLVQVSTARTPIRRLDDYRTENGLGAPDLLKLDVQGYELEVLSAANESLKAAKALIIEVSFLEYYQAQPLFSQVCAYLRSKGFELRALGVSTALGRPLTQADGLFTRS